MHLATHAAFNPGSLDRSYVQFWDDRLTLDEVSDLDLTDLEMLILSACSTALGRPDADLGFAGLAASAAFFAKGEIRLENNRLVTQKGENVLPDGLVGDEAIAFSHPFFWSAFTLVGSPWW